MIEKEVKKDKFYERLTDYGPDPHFWPDTIPLDENHVICHDRWCWMLYTKAKVGTTYYPSYHMTLRQTLLDYLEDSLKTSDSVSGILSRLDEIEALIQTVTIKKVL